MREMSQENVSCICEGHVIPVCHVHQYEVHLNATIEYELEIQRSN